MRRIGLVYFLYLFFYSGLEFTLTFLTHNRFQYDRLVHPHILLAKLWQISSHQTTQWQGRHPFIYVCWGGGTSIGFS